MSEISRLLENNQAWARQVTQDDPEFFSKLATGQQPEYLWIGCSDSRVPAARVAGFQPGEAFVHRNIANQVILADANLRSVLEYGVLVLKVKHIIICGHYGCGGVAAAVGERPPGVIDQWLEQLRIINERHAAELETIVGDDNRLARLCELNVIEQVQNVDRSSVVQQALDAGQQLSVHGLIYSLEDGLLKELEAPNSPPLTTLAAR